MSVTARPSPPPPTDTRLTVDASASSVEFSVRQFWGLSFVRGRFSRFDGDLKLPADGVGRAELMLEAASVETGNRRRDRHLRSRDYFDARQLGMSWSPVGSLRTPVTLTIRACLGG